MKLFKSKKANAIVDTIVIVVVLFITALIFIFGQKIFSDVKDNINADTDISASAKVPMNSLYSVYPAIFDGILFFLLIGFWISAIIFSFMIDTNPIFLVITIIGLAIILFMSMVISNSFQDITGDSNVSSYAANYPKINFIFEHILETILVISMSIAVALFAKSRL